MGGHFCYDCFIKKIADYHDISDITVSFEIEDDICDDCGKYGHIVKNLICCNDSSDKDDCKY